MSTVPDRFGIVQVVQEFSRSGGVETVAFELQRVWERDGTPATVLAATSDAPPEQLHHVRFALPPGLTRRIPTRGYGRYLGRSLVVPGFTLSASVALWRGSRPKGWADERVILSHGDSLIADVIVLHAINAESLAQKRQDGEWQWALNPMHLWVGARDRLMLRGRRARRYVAVSRRVAEEVANHHGVPASRIVVIPNGTDLARFTPEGDRADLRGQFTIPDAAPLLLFVAHEFERKGLPFVIKALTHVGCGDVHVVAVGAGDQEGAAKQAAQAGVKDRVHFTGPRRDLPDLYRAADAFILPSAYETFSLVCLDAMACGRPVFATRVGGIEDYLRDGQNGLTILRDSDAIGATLADALHNRALLTRWGEAGRQTALAFSWENIASRYRTMLIEVWAEKWPRALPHQR